MHLPCIITGDFNVTISPQEKKGGSKVRDPFGERLEDVITSWKLADIKKRKGKYMWSNKRTGPGHIAARLDCILVSSSMLHKPFLPVSRLLTTVVFGHKPIIFSLDPIGNLSTQPFNFSPVWLNEPRLYSVVS